MSLTPPPIALLDKPGWAVGAAILGALTLGQGAPAAVCLRALRSWVDE